MSVSNKIGRLTWNDLRYTWHDLLSGAAESRDSDELTLKARDVERSLNRKHNDISDPARALVYLLNKSGVQRVWDDIQSWHSVSFDEHIKRVEAFHRQLNDCLVLIDSEYIPKKTCFRRSLRGKSLVAHFPWLNMGITAAKVNICKALYRAGLCVKHVQERALCDSSARSFDTRIDGLADSAYRFRLLAWRVQRSLRLRGEHPVATNDSTEYLEADRLWELKQLWYAAQAAAERGYRATSAAIGAKLLDQIAEWYSNEEKLDAELREAVERSCESVKSLGFRVPAIFRDDGKFSTKRPAGAEAYNILAEGSTASLPDGLREDRDPPPASLLYRIYREVPRSYFVNLAQTLNGHFREGQHPLTFIKGFLIPRMKNLGLPDHVRQEVFNLCIRLDQLRQAFRLLEYCPSWTPNAENLKSLAHRLLTAQRTMPAAIRDEKQAEWLERFCAAWGLMDTNDAQDSLIHQALLGRMTSLAMGSGNAPTDARLLADAKDSGVLKRTHQFRPEVEVARFYDVQRFVLKMHDRARSVVLSVAPRGDSLHVYAFSSDCPNYRGPMGSVNLTNCRRSAAILRVHMSRDTLLNRTFWNNTDMRPLAELGRQLMGHVNGLDSECELLMLAIEPALAAIPWNVLLPIVLGSNTPILSLIPSLSWLADHDRITRTRSDQHPEPSLVAATSEMLARKYPTARAEFERLIMTAKKLFAGIDRPTLSIAVGHGLWDAAKKMTTVDGPEGHITLEEWCRVLAADFVLLLSCHGGKTEEQLIADLAGLPGLALATGCRCLLAPVTKLRPSDLADLGEVLLQPDSGATVLAKLKTAFGLFPVSRQMAIFGDPTSTLRYKIASIPEIAR